MKINSQDVLAKNKGILAKLMAAENITVQHRQTKTARFDLKKRILTCPIWKDMNGDIYDLLMGHEISHALHTPMEGWHSTISADKQRKNLKRFLNIIEDARIERMIKAKYPGLRRPFIEAYRKLFEQDLFKIKKLKGDYSSLNLIDRINVHFKLGAHATIIFDKEEQVFVDRAAKAKTWDEVVEIARDVYDYCKFNEPKKDKKKQQKKQEKSEENEPDSEQGESDEFGDEESSGNTEEGDDDSEDGDDTKSDKDDSDEEGEDSDDDGESSDADSDGDSESDDDSDSDGDSDDESEAAPTKNDKSSKNKAGLNKKGDVDEDEGSDEENNTPPVEPDSATDEAFRANEDSLLDAAGYGTMYVNLPDVNLKNIIVDNKQVLSKFERGATNDLSKANYGKMNFNEIQFKLNTIFHRRNKNYISLLVKEFEMKKNANQYARQLVSKSGELDDRKLARYRLSNDIFRKVTTVTKGKSHGMILFLDLSGSMEHCLRPIIEQLLILVTFCKRVGIPFDAYGFGDTHAYYEHNMMHGNLFIPEQDACGFYGDKFNLRHLISSSFSSNSYKRAFNMLNYIGQVSESSGRDQETQQVFAPVTYKCAPAVFGFNMGGTPYMQTLVASREIIKQFKNNHHSDIINVIYLTDGDGDSNITLPHEFMTMSPTEQRNTVIGFQDPVTKVRVLTEANTQLPYQTAITNLISQSLGVRQFGFYFGQEYMIKDKMRRNLKLMPNIGKLDNDLAKNGFVAVPNLGYKTYYYVNIDNMTYTRPLNVNSTMNDANMLGEFRKHQQKKMNSKLIVRQFAAEVAE